MKLLKYASHLLDILRFLDLKKDRRSSHGVRLKVMALTLIVLRREIPMFLCTLFKTLLYLACTLYTPSIPRSSSES